MFYALLLVCLASVVDCDAEHAIWAQQSPPIFQSEYGCRFAALARVHKHLPDILAIEPDADLRIVVTCEWAELKTDL